MFKCPICGKDFEELYEYSKHIAMESDNAARKKLDEAAKEKRKKLEEEAAEREKKAKEKLEKLEIEIKNRAENLTNLIEEYNSLSKDREYVFYYRCKDHKSSFENLINELLNSYTF